MQLADLVHTATQKLLPPTTEQDVLASMRLFSAILSCDNDMDDSEALRTHFITKHYTQTARLLLKDEVIGTWWNCWSTEQRKATFGSFFVSPPAPAVKSFIVLAESLGSSEAILRFIEHSFDGIGLKLTINEACNASSPEWGRFLTLLLSLPDRIAGLVKTAPQGRWMPEKHMKAILHAIDHHDDRISELIGRMAVLGWSDCIAAWCVEETQLGKQVLLSLSDRVLRPVHEALYSHASHTQLLNLLAEQWLDDEAWHRVAVVWQWLLTMRVCTSQVSHAVIRLATDASDTRPSALHDLVLALAKLWSSAAFTDTTANDQHIHVTRCVMMGCKAMTGIKDTAVQRTLMSGVQHRLSSAVTFVRHMGMLVGECISTLVDPDNPLKFDAEYSTDELQALELPVPQSSEAISDVIETEPVEDDDNDSLFAYDLSNDKQVSAVPVPTHPRDLDEYLTCNGDDRGVKVDAALTAACDVIRQKHHDLDTIAPSLVTTLLHLTNETGIEGFGELQLDALSALVSCSPGVAAVHIAQQFSADYYALNQREMCLIAIERGARELSTFTPSPKPLIAPVTSAKTRRFPSAPPPTTHINTFLPHSQPIYHALARQWGKNDAFDTVEKDSTLLKSIIRTMSVIVDCAGPNVNADLPLSLMEVAGQWRQHDSAAVRAATLYAMAVAIQVLDGPQFDIVVRPNMVEKWIEWLTHAAKHDPDKRCRSLAAAAMTVLSEALPE